jgi:hypothetical protein
LTLGKLEAWDEFKSFQHSNSIFRDFYTALTFLFAFCVKTKTKSLPGSRAWQVNMAKDIVVDTIRYCTIFVPTNSYSSKFETASQHE